ncbi:hypothetical protein KK083_22850 [Fulvivirgaceae bacterium PWU4]|uniref:RHS repeat protein n=1 Tax=Chryseosolibacter histidini TaxID=2782349 RepID=A0AAP2GL49_9BACT|nr:hypothetical protein [Chryseosolibacter histidini]MBT1699744.1 hypothetical protein [Chryseosolibacter histidini]
MKTLLRISMISSLIMYFSFPRCAAQDLERLIPKTTPPAPEAASLGKYGEIPVSHYTGVPNISIPIYEIRSRDITLPVSISYHASGMQVKEEASWVGLGWTLNAGGAVTRSIRGGDDFGGAFCYWSNRSNMPPAPAKNPHEDPFQILYFNQNTPTLTVYFPGDTRNYYGDLIDASRDWASDIYYFSCGELNGKFVIDRNGDFVPVDHQDIKIEMFNRKYPNANCAGSGEFGGWKITAADGTQYFFGEPDCSPANNTYSPYYQCSNTNTVAKNVNGFTQAVNMLNLGGSPITSWFVKKIVSPMGEEITFEYDKAASSLDFIAPIPDYSQYFIHGEGTYCNEQGYSPTEGRVSVSYTVHQPHYLRQINFKNGYIKLNRDPVKRQDLSGAERLSDIQVFQRSSVTGEEKIIRTFQFKNNAYFTSANDVSPNYNGLLPGAGDGLGGFINDFASANGKRLKLTGLIESNGTLKKLHQFEYTTTDLPRKTSHSVDHWGHFNAIDNANLVPEVYWPSHTFYVQRPNDPAPVAFIVAGQHISGAVRTANGVSAQAALLKKVIYPTGGWTEFFFEANQFTEDNTLKSGGGLRVAKVQDTDPVTNKTITRAYRYQNGKQITPVRNFMVKYCGYSSASTTGCGGLVCDGPNGGWYTSLSPALYRYSSPIYPMSNAAAGSPVGYDRVELWNGENAENGKTAYEFHNEPDQVLPVDKHGFAYWPGIPGLSDPQNGNLLWQTEYAKDATQSTGFRAIKSVKNNYVDFSASWANKTKYLWNIFVHIQPSSGGTTSASVGAWTYPVATTWNHLTSTEERLFTPGQPDVVTNTRYGYHNATPSTTKHHQLLSKSTTNSDGLIKTSLYYYPPDYNAGTMSGVIGTLNSRNFRSRVIEERIIDGETSGNALGGSVTRYNALGQPTQIHMAETTLPVSGIVQDPNSIIPGTGLYKQRADISYDANNNISTQKKLNDVPVTYLWAYGNTLPVAEVKNAVQKTITEIITPAPVPLSTVTNGQMSDFELMGYFDVTEAQTLYFDRTTQVIAGSSPNAIIEFQIKDENGNFEYGPSTTPYFPLALPVGRHFLYHKSNITWAEGPGGGDLQITLTVSYTVTHTRNMQDIFYTSFEESIEHVSSEARTGTRSYNGTYIIPKPVTNGAYILSYWRKPSTSGGAWTLFESTVNIVAASNDIVVGGTGYLVDEVRFYPAGAQMTTYTYDPLTGMTSATDANNRSKYFDYDDLGRLIRIRNDEGDIEKHYTYNYKQ